MMVLSTQGGQVSLWISDKVRFKNISLDGINVNLMYRLVPCAGRAFGPSPARPAARGPGLYIILRAGPGRAYILQARAGPGLKTI